MALYPGRALERAMKIQEVILRAIGKQLSWIEAAEIIGVSPPDDKEVARALRARWLRRGVRSALVGLLTRRFFEGIATGVAICRDAMSLSLLGDSLTTKKGREVGSLPLDQHCCPSLFRTSESGPWVK